MDVLQKLPAAVSVKRPGCRLGRKSKKLNERFVKKLDYTELSAQMGYIRR